MKRLLPLIAGVALVASAGEPGEPVWTQIMWQGGTTGESSAEYFQLNATTTYTPETKLGSPITLEDNNGSIYQGSTTWVADCTSYPGPPPGQLYRSYLGPWNYPTSTYKGLEAYVTFGYQASDIIYMPTGSALEQAIFFTEVQCYNPSGHEYGLLLNGRNGYFEFYYQDDISGLVAHDVLGAGWTGKEYIFDMWPVYDGIDSKGLPECHFETRVKDPSTYAVLNSLPSTISYANLVSTGIISADPTLCQQTSRIFNEQGYVTALTKVVQPTVTFGSGAYNSFQMNVSAINIGK